MDARLAFGRVERPVAGRTVLVGVENLAFPGELSRMAAAAQAGRIAATAMVGVMMMLLFAGLLEGIGRQTITGDTARYAIGGGMLALWIAYFYLLRMVRLGNG